MIAPSLAFPTRGWSAMLMIGGSVSVARSIGSTGRQATCLWSKSLSASTPWTSSWCGYYTGTRPRSARVRKSETMSLVHDPARTSVKKSIKIDAGPIPRARVAPVLCGRTSSAPEVYSYTIVFAERSCRSRHGSVIKCIQYSQHVAGSTPDAECRRDQ